MVNASYIVCKSESASSFCHRMHFDSFGGYTKMYTMQRPLVRQTFLEL